MDLGDKVHLSKRALIAHLKADETVTKVLSQYADFADIFLSKLVAELSEYTGIKDHAIELVDDWQSLYSLIYSLGPVELEILKTYIENNLANDFIKPSKSPIGVTIFFDKKPNGRLRLSRDYRGLNNLIIKNKYPLLLIKESLD